MCGICGIFSFKHKVAPTVVQKMNQLLRHRGPDDEGYLIADTKAGIFSPRTGDETIPALRNRLESVSKMNGFAPNLVFGHRRLSIIDLSEKGHQPMTRDGNWIVYNGEIYNYIELRRELTTFGHSFETGSDTEVILTAYQEWGFDCLHRFNGMWAFAIWDNQRKQLFCSRDRFGIKPFYFHLSKKHFVFASEIKAILASSLSKVEPNDRAIYEFLTYGLVDHLKETFFRDIYRLVPGEYLLINNSGVSIFYSWWKLNGREVPSDTREAFRQLFKDSIRLRLRSDVPVGSCLSGGLDSSYVVSQMAELGDTVNTFSAVYGKGLHGDESEFIDEVVQKVGATKHTVIPGPIELKRELQDLIYHQEEPFGSTSIFAQWKVMELARSREVTVLLDGQGADEQLGGYNKYFGIFFGILFKRFKWIKLANSLIDYLRLHKKRNIFAHTIYYTLPQKLRKIARNRLVPLKTEFRKKYTHCHPDDYPDNFNEVLKYFIVNSLPQLLRYEDKNSMAFSRETRLPFLDYRLVELIYSLPVDDKIDRAVTKIIMRKAMKGIVSERIRNRHDKVGFETPELEWFRRELKPYIMSILNSDRFSTRPYWDSEKIKAVYESLMQGRSNSNMIWRFISVELWLRSFID